MPKILAIALSCGLLAFAAPGGGLPCTVYPDAIFSPDGEWIYYVQSEMNGRYRHTIFSSLIREFPYGYVARERIDREVIMIRRMRRETGEDQVVQAIPTGPWLGVFYNTEDCGEYRFASLEFDPAGKLTFKIFGPSLRSDKDWRESRVSNELFVYSDAEPVWKKTVFKTFPAIPYSKSDHKWKNLELDRIDSQWWWLLDHDTRTYKVVLAGSDSVGKYAKGFTFDGILAATRPWAR